jgi:carboxyl-terminal processing protease
MKNLSTLFLAAAITSVVIATPSLATVNETGTEALEALMPLPIHTTTTQNIVDALSSRHYVAAALNDDLSSRIFDTYIEDLDPSRSYFLQSDIDEFEQYRYEMDDALKRGNLSPAFDIFNRYHQRVITRFEKVLTTLDEGVDKFDFTKPEDLLIDRKNSPWAETEAQLDDLWRKRVKDAVLNLKLTDKEPEKIQELLHKRFSNRLTRSRQTNNEDVYQLYMNSFTKTYDPHTQYFSPRTSENFNINMSLSLEGIGAVLQLEDEYTKVVSLVTAGPADKAGVIKPNDKIVAVGQGQDGDMIDVIGWRLDEVVQLIRGPKDTVVRLDIIAASDGDAKPKIISIVRNKVELEEQSAHAKVIEIEEFGALHKIGVVSISTFYIDFQALQKGDRNYKSTTRDVKKLIRDLQDQDVDGIVIDLRDNGGGSLQEAKLLTGLFIDRGPTVQIRSKSNRVDILDDRDISIVYDGPLAVLVNRLSASASEIFAGAIQDYERGIIIGSQTFGKGTVQSLLPLNRGQLKLTQAKFYRISGESTQEKGIIPDIEYPSSYDPESIGESTLDAPLPWDKITATNYRRKHSINHLVPELKSLHDERVADNADFNYLKEAFAYRKARNEDNTVSLNEVQRLQEKSDREGFWLGLENKKRLALGQKAIASLDELNEKEPTVASIDSPDAGAAGAAIVPENSNGETTEPVPGSEMAGSDPAIPVLETATTGEEHGEENETPDPYLVETGHILLDLISLEERTAAELRQSHGS